ncbi:hypothetical protein CCB80_10295 [Armatimonadetes bacterium Uphvl-Ar1]|nr:hypothetical protein CCB80_10295 [Armatimonadetes bacterium Uphvl-Ar1]
MTSEQESGEVGVARDRYISLVIPGGVALGAYYAGAIAQIGFFLAKWDDLRTSGQDDLPAIHLDVISGASAGALTGAMLFQFIGSNFYKTSEMGQPDDLEKRLMVWLQNNFDAWCQEYLNMESLLSKGVNRTSILNPDPIEAIAGKMIPVIKPSLPSGQKRLIYTCTLTGVDPVNYELEMDAAPCVFEESSDRLVDMLGRTRRDWITFRIHSFQDQYPSRNLVYRSGDIVFEEIASDKEGFAGRDSLSVLWTRLKWSALASGAFPFAWNPIQMERSTRYYPDVEYGRTGFREMKYSDGGIIDNMPLDRACKVLRDYSQMEGGDQAGLFDKRTYIFISTDLADSQYRIRTDPSLSSGIDPGRYPLFRQGVLAGALFESVREQSFFDDLRDAKRINEQLKNRQHLLWPQFARYTKLLARKTLVSECSQMRLDILNLISEGKSNPNKKYVRSKYRFTLRQVAYRDTVQEMGRQHRMTSVQFFHLVLNILLNDFVHGNAQKHELHVAQIRATERLNSQFMGNFGGFINEDFMKRDFIIGMKSASAWLSEWIAEEKLHRLTVASERHWNKLTPNAILPNPNVPNSYAALPSKDRSRFEQNLSEAIGRYFKFVPLIRTLSLWIGVGLVVSSLLLFGLSVTRVLPLLTSAGAFAWVLLLAIGCGLLHLYRNYFSQPGSALLKMLNKATERQVQTIEQSGMAESSLLE